MNTRSLIHSSLAAGVLAASMAALTPAHASTSPQSINIDGPSVTFNLSVGEEAVANFSGLKGQRVTVQTVVTNASTYPSATRDIEIDVVNVRTGRTLADVGADYEDLFEGAGEAVTLTENGDYQLRVSPDQNFAGDVTLTLKSPLRSGIPLDGTLSFDLGVGEEVIASFEGTKGQLVTVQTLASLVQRFPSNLANLDVNVVNARTGRSVEYVGGDYEDVFNGIGEAVRLPVTGPYEIRVSPNQYFVGYVTLGLKSPQVAAMSVGSGPNTFGLEVGEEAIATFSAAKDELVTIRTVATSVTRYPSPSADLDIYVVNSRTGRQVASIGDDYSDAFDGIGNTVKIPLAGQYEVRLSPDQYFTGDVTIELTSPVREPISLDGSPLTFDLGIGDEAVATFTAKKDQRMTIQVSIARGSRYPGSYSNLDVYLINSRTGRVVTNAGDDYADVLEGVSKTVQLRDAGQYQLRISPDQYFAGAVTISVTTLT